MCIRDSAGPGTCLQDGRYWPVSLPQHAGPGTCLQDGRYWPMSLPQHAGPGTCLQRGLHWPVSLSRHVVPGTCLQDVRNFGLKCNPRGARSFASGNSVTRVTSFVGRQKADLGYNVLGSVWGGRNTTSTGARWTGNWFSTFGLHIATGWDRDPRRLMEGGRGQL